jgi:hypothetical protein
MTDATWEQAKHFLTFVSQKGTRGSQLQKLVVSGLLSDLLDANVDEVDRDAFRKLLGLTPVELHIVVDYMMSLEAMIAAGHYDWVNDNITSSRFPLKGDGRKDLAAEVIHFNRDISSDNAVADLNRMGLRPGTIEELLAFGAEFPEMQRQFPIIALGSSCKVDGVRRVASLGGGGSRRSLYLLWWVLGWVRDSRFLGFRK